MRKFKNLVIGGIQNKIFNLILLTVILLVAAFTIIMLYQGSMLRSLSQDTYAKQDRTVSDATAAVLDEAVRASMQNSTMQNAMLTNELFDDLKLRVSLIGSYAEKILRDPDSVPPAEVHEPNKDDDGKLTAMVLYANDEAANDPVLAEKLHVAANLTDMMIAVCNASGTNNAYIALPDGATITVNTVSAGHFTGETVNRFDAAERYWYQLAVEAGELVFTDIGTDRGSTELCVTCSMPIYDENGELLAVVGSDIFKKEMQEGIDAASTRGGFVIVVNAEGHVMIEPNTESIFHMRDREEAEDLRLSGEPELAAFVTEALEGSTDVKLVNFANGTYYMCAAPMQTRGWTMISVFDKNLADQPVQTLSARMMDIQQDAAGTYNANFKRLQVYSFIIMAALMIALLWLSLWLGKRIVKPLNTITQRIAEIDESNIEFKMEDAYRTGDEIEVLAKSFADISHKTVQYVHEVQRVTAEKERIGTELNMAKQIQAAMLPHMFPPFPERSEFDLYASMTPAKEVGGDFYDFFLIDNDHLCLVMADVSGKGVPAALFMMVSKVILQSCAMLGKSPAEILQKTNTALCHDNQVEMFVTVWLGILEISTGKLTCANAGHEYPTIKHGDAFELYKDKHGFVIGGLEGAKYKEYELQLAPGDKLFVYTDGVTEATNESMQLFGTGRMLEALNKNPAANPAETLTNVRSDIDTFVGAAEQFDDLTMLCLEYKGTDKMKKDNAQQ